MRIASALTRALGPLAHPMADAVALGAWVAHPQTAGRTARNHRRAAPEISARVARRRARASFQEYGRMAVDIIWASGAGDHRLEERAEVSGWEHIDAVRRRRGGAILAMCHFGSWDMAVSVGLVRGLTIATVMAPVGPRWLTGIVAWERRRHGLVLLDLDRAARGFLRTLRHGGLVGVMMDIPEHGPEVTVPFCGGPVRFSAVAARLSIGTGAPILAVDCRPDGSRYRLRVHPPLTPAAGEDEVGLTGRLATVLEAAVRESPRHWYPFHRVYADEPPS